MSECAGVGANTRVLNSLLGCQYRMTSYDEDVDRSDLNPAYGIHLHDPRLLEYVGVPESARLLSRSPEYWFNHLGRDRAMSAALQLQYDAGLILSNLQVLGQFVTLLSRMSSEVMRVAFAAAHRSTGSIIWVGIALCQALCSFSMTRDSSDLTCRFLDSL